MKPHKSSYRPELPAGRFVEFAVVSRTTYALGLTYAEHIRETGYRACAPVVFRKHCQAVPAGQQFIEMPSSQALHQAIARHDAGLANWLQAHFDVLPVLLDYEVEVGIVVLEDIPAQAMDDPDYQPAIGYFVANDLTARSVQICGEGAADPLVFWSSSKSFNGFLPVCERVWLPCNPMFDSFPDIAVRTCVNGDNRQQSRTADIILTPRQLLQRAASQAPDQILRSQDLVLTGTPSGVAFGMARWQRALGQLLPRHQRIVAALRANQRNSHYLKPGDRLTFDADWLGSVQVSIDG